MATITASGIGSGLDTNGIITQLMSIERQPIDALTKRVTSSQSKLSALGQLKSGMSSLQSAAELLAKPEKFAAFKATIGDPTLFGAAVGSTATAGSYGVEVQFLAQAHKLVAPGVASSSTTVGTGTLTIEVGQLTGGVYTPDVAKGLSLTIDGTNNTLAGVRDAINAAKKGVTATIVDDGSANPSRLVITANDTGTSNTIRMSGIAGLDFDPVAASGSLDPTSPAQDAKIKIDGILVTRSSNTVSDAIAGVTLNLTKANLGVTTTLTVASDKDTVKKNIESFVKAYNDLNTTVRTQTAADPTAKTSAILNGDGTVRSMSTTLRRLVGQNVTGAPGGYSRLSEIGIAFQSDGSLKLDSAKLDAALSDPTKDVSGVFGNAAGTLGVARDVAKEIKTMLGVGGLFTNHTDSINSSIRRLNTQKDNLEVRMVRTEARLRAQYTALDLTMSSLNKTSQYLTQQLAALSNSS